MKNIDTKYFIGGFIGLVVLLLLISQLTGGTGGGVVSPQQAGIGSIASSSQDDATVAPDFTLEKLGGGTISLSDYRGEKPVVLDFFATWCPNCQRDMPKLSKLYEKYKDEVEVIGINLQESEGTVEQFISSRGIDFPIVLDPRGQVSNIYGVRYTNYHILIDKEGNITGVVPGDMKESHLTSLIAN